MRFDLIGHPHRGAVRQVGLEQDDAKAVFRGQPRRRLEICSTAARSAADAALDWSAALTSANLRMAPISICLIIDSASTSVYQERAALHGDDVVSIEALWIAGLVEPGNSFKVVRRERRADG